MLCTDLQKWPEKFQPSDKKLFGPAGISLPVIGQIEAQLRVDNWTILIKKIYAVDNQNSGLLSKYACISQGLIQCDTKYGYNIDTNVDKSAKFINEFSDVFQAWAKLMLQSHTEFS